MEDPNQLAEYLTMKDIISEAGPNLLSYASKHRRANLLQAVRESPALQEVVIRAFHRKQSRQEEQRETQLKKACLNDTALENELQDDSSLFNNPEDKVKKNALAQFIDRTGNFHTRQSTCLSCAREDFVDNMEGVYLDEIPN